MIILDFQLGFDSIEDSIDEETSISSEMGGAIYIGAFYADVRFCVNGVEIVGRWKERKLAWDNQPLIAFSVDIEAAVMRACGGLKATSYMESDRDLEFEPRNGRILVSNCRGALASAPSRELLTAASEFRRRAGAELREAVPDLANHPDWLKWFPD